MLPKKEEVIVCVNSYSDGEIWGGLATDNSDAITQAKAHFASKCIEEAKMLSIQHNESISPTEVRVWGLTLSDVLKYKDGDFTVYTFGNPQSISGGSQ